MSRRRIGQEAFAAKIIMAPPPPPTINGGKGKNGTRNKFKTKFAQLRSKLIQLNLNLNSGPFRSDD